LKDRKKSKKQAKKDKKVDDKKEKLLRAEGSAVAIEEIAKEPEKKVKKEIILKNLNLSIK